MVWGQNKYENGNGGGGRSYRKTGELQGSQRVLRQWEILGWEAPGLAVREAVQGS